MRSAFTCAAECLSVQLERHARNVVGVDWFLVLSVCGAAVEELTQGINRVLRVIQDQTATDLSGRTFVVSVHVCR